MKYILLTLLFAANCFAGQFNVYDQTLVTVTTTSTQELAADAAANYLIIQNLGSTTVIVKFGSAQSGSEGIQIPAGGNYEPILTPTDSIWMKSASSTDSVMIVRGH